MKSYLLTTSVAVLALLSGTAAAETVTTTTVVTQQAIPHTNEINFIAFDIDNNGILTMNEVGEKLFDLFDTDDNHQIDNIEFDRKNVMTIIPMEKLTLRLVDIDSDGSSEATSHTYETFIQRSNLMRFDKNMDGLSAAEFIATGYQELDDDDDNLINLEEWKEVYIASLSPATSEPERYN